MTIQQTRVRRNLKVNQGRIIRTERQLGRLEKRIERLENRNANLKAELSKLRARVDQNTKDNKHCANSITRLMGLSAPVQALVRSFKQTPGAPFAAWRMWMLSTFRKQGLYRKRMFG